MGMGDIIARKRDGNALNTLEIEELVRGLVDGSMADAQAGAFAMAVLLKGMDAGERVALTRAMQHSGSTLAWDLPGPVVDKHSTGGVGDNVSLILAPALAACGCFVPMISGRGLGHTGGTLDKLEAIPGYDVAPGLEEFRRVVGSAGCAIVGQTSDLAPADKRLYAIRDVTGTVESVDLVCASILSKKLAAGVEVLLLDVKTGSGAFMQGEADARELARTLVEVANGAGCKTAALVTDMSEPLASAAGNGLEVANAAAFLAGAEVDARLWDVVVALGAEVLAMAGIADGQAKVSDALQSGAAAERFGKMIKELGGPGDFIDRFMEHLPRAPVVRDVYAAGEGFVESIDTRAIGSAVVALGGGRRVPSDDVRPDVGFDRILGIGSGVDGQTPIARVHAKSAEDADAASSALRAAYQVSDVPPGEIELVRDIVR